MKTISVEDIISVFDQNTQIHHNCIYLYLHL